MKGTRVVLTGAEGPDGVIFQHCSGGCSAHRTTAAKMEDGQLSFEIVSRARETESAQFTGRLKGSVLELKGVTSAFPFKSARLRKNQACPRDAVKADA